MEENPVDNPTLDNIDFIFRHTWLIFSSFLIIFNIFQAYSTTIPPVYNTKAVLLFESAIGTGAKKDIINEKKDAAEKILTGANVEPILDQVVKSKFPADRKAAYERLKGALLNIKTGLNFSWEPKGTGYLLNINFSYGDPTDCYRTVKATMDMIIKESEQRFIREMEANTLFLNNQLKFYRGKLDVINQEMDGIKGELLNKYADLSSQEKQAVSKFLDGKAASEKSEVEGPATKEDEISKLRTDLGDLQEKRKALQSSLEDGSFMAQSVLEDISDEDMYLKEYRKTIAVKEMEIDSLIARGYKEEHPLVKQLRQEVDRAKEIRQRHMDRMKPGGPGSQAHEEAKERVELQIKELDVKISLIVNNLKNAGVLDSGPAAATAQTSGSVKEKITRLTALEGERAINEGYYVEMRKALANAELKFRTDNENVGFSISVIQEPTLPVSPDSSKARGTVLRGFIIAIILAFGIGYLAYMFKNAVYSERELGGLTGVPILASIDNIITKRQMAVKKTRFRYGVVAAAAAMVISRIMVSAIFK